MTKKFKDLLLTIQDRTMKEQEKYLEKFVGVGWKGLNRLTISWSLGSGCSRLYKLCQGFETLTEFDLRS